VRPKSLPAHRFLNKNTAYNNAAKKASSLSTLLGDLASLLIFLIYPDLSIPAVRRSEGQHHGAGVVICRCCCLLP
jgi:hypothetical protein